MQIREGVAAAVVVAALVGRLVSDRRQNKRVEGKRRELARQAAFAFSASADRVTQLPGQEIAGVTTHRALLALCLLMLAGILTLQVTGRTTRLPAVVAALGCGIAIFLQRVPRWKVKPRVAFVEKENSAPAAVLSETPPKVVRHDLTGTWIKDKDASESMAAAIEVAQLNRITRAAVRLIKGIQIVDSDLFFEMAVFSVIGWFKVREVYPRTGELCLQKRRDLRRGHHKGRVRITAEGHIRMEFEWPDPIAGKGFDEFRLVAPEELHVFSLISVSGRVVEYKTVYRKR